MANQTSPLAFRVKCHNGTVGSPVQLSITVYLSAIKDIAMSDTLNWCVLIDSVSFLWHRVIRTRFFQVYNGLCLSTYVSAARSTLSEVNLKTSIFFSVSQHQLLITVYLKCPGQPKTFPSTQNLKVSEPGSMKYKKMEQEMNTEETTPVLFGIFMVYAWNKKKIYRFHIL